MTKKIDDLNTHDVTQMSKNSLDAITTRANNPLFNQEIYNRLKDVDTLEFLRAMNKKWGFEDAK